MLTYEAINSAQALTQVLDGRRMFLTPIEGTPLAQLVAATRADEKMLNAEGGGEPVVDIKTMHMLANKKDKLLDFSQHDLAMEEIVQVATRAVNSHMQYARTIVAPAVARLVESTEQTLRAMTPSSLLGMNVVLWAPPAPLELPTFETLVSKFADVPYDSPSMLLNLPSITAKEIAELASTGSGAIDGAIEAWLAAKGEDFLNAIWTSVFQINAVPVGSRAPGFRNIIEDPTDGIDAALAIFLIARKLVDKGPLPNTQMNLREFENTAAEFRNQAAARLCRVMEDWSKVIKARLLVRRTEGKNTAVVNAPVYHEWVKAGGENEVLFGALVKNATVVTVDQINEQKDDLKGAWVRYEALTAQIESNKRFQRMKDVLSRHFDQHLREITDEEEAAEANRQMVMKLFNEQLALVTLEEMNDLWALCLKLVCRSRFFRTDAEHILAGVDRVKKATPSLSIREAAAVSMIEYISWWVAKQFKATKL